MLALSQPIGMKAIMYNTKQNYPYAQTNCNTAQTKTKPNPNNSQVTKENPQPRINNTTVARSLLEIASADLSYYL